MDKRITRAQFIGFIAVGMVSSIYGSMIPAIRETIPMNYQGTGLILSARALGMLLIVILSIFLIGKVGLKRTLLHGGALLILGLVGNVLSGQYVFLFVSTLVTGLGYGMYQVGINALCAEQSDAHPGRAMNYLHFFFSVGTVLAPILATICITTLKNWRIGFLGLAILPFIANLQFTSLRPQQSDILNLKKDYPFHQLILWLLGVMVFMCAGLDAAVYNWLPIFWETVGKGSSIPPSLTTSIYAISVALGRLIFSKLPDRLGLARCLALTGFCGVVMMIGCCLFPGLTLWFVGLLGLANSIVFPVIMAWGTSAFPGWAGQISSFLFVFSPLGGSLVPSCIGKIAAHFGIEILPTVLLIMALGLFSVAILAWRHSSRSKMDKLINGVID